MSKSINFNEVRRLAKQAAKKRPILGCIRINDNGTATWTDSYYLVVMSGYSSGREATINLEDYSLNDKEYPALNRIIGQAFQHNPAESIIIDGQVVYRFTQVNSNGEIVKTYLDQKIIKQVEKLVSIKGFKLDIAALKLSESQSMAELKVDDDTKIYFMLTRKYISC